MSTYNFAKSKEKNLDDTHTEMRLKEQHEEAPEVVTEKQLEKKDHEGEPDVTIEKQLEKVRTGSAETIIEKNLNDSKGLFGSNFRNPKAYEGDINKVEEKRLSGKKAEDEKYSASSSTPKQVKWWDGLKKAQSDKVVKTAAFDDFGDDDGDPDITGPSAYGDFDPATRFERLKEMPGIDPDAEGIIQDPSAPDIATLSTEGVESEINTPSLISPPVNKEGQTPVPHIFMKFDFNPEDFNGDEEAMKSAAMEKALELRPNLEGKISVDDFSNPEGGTVKLRLVGDEYFSTSEASNFISVEEEDVDVGGTPMSVGRVVLGPQAESMGEEGLLQGIVDFIASKRGIDVPPSAIQINLEKGEATFAFDPENPTAVINPPVEDVGEVEEPEADEEEEDDIFDADEEEEVEEVEETPLAQTLDSVVSKSEYDFPIVIADSSDSKKK